jgi:hypothetical protein
MEERGLDLKHGGHMYEVNINADPDAFLDWDKPLSGAAKDAAFNALTARGLDKTLADYIAGSRPGSDVYSTLTRGAYDTRLAPSDTGSPAATAALKQAGIPGIKYLDAGSRATSGGEVLGVEKVGNGYVAKVRVQNRGGVGMAGAPTDMVTTSKPYATAEEAQQWADSKVNTGSRNYVVFSDEIIDIVKKYGIAGALGAGLITQQMADQLEAQQGGGQS